MYLFDGSLLLWCSLCQLFGSFLADETRKRCREQGYPKFTDEQIKAYTELGGTPFLDGQYTVFGEVVEGLEVVEKIQNCETLRDDRPKEDVVMQVEVVNE